MDLLLEIDEDTFKPYLQRFAASVWGVLMKVSHKPGQVGVRGREGREGRGGARGGARGGEGRAGEGRGGEGRGGAGQGRLAVVGSTRRRPRRGPAARAPRAAPAGRAGAGGGGGGAGKAGCRGEQAEAAGTYRSSLFLPQKQWFNVNPQSIGHALRVAFCVGFG